MMSFTTNPFCIFSNLVSSWKIYQGWKKLGIGVGMMSFERSLTKILCYTFVGSIY
jgi:hypothetical protein